jgi:hypothetical protein
MAQKISVAPQFPQSGNLTFTWVGWDNTEYSSVFRVASGVMTRRYSENGRVSTSAVASHINTGAGKTTCTSNNGTVIIKITSSVGGGDRVSDVTKIREISSRPNL